MHTAAYAGSLKLSVIGFASASTDMMDGPPGAVCMAGARGSGGGSLRGGGGSGRMIISAAALAAGVCSGILLRGAGGRIGLVGCLWSGRRSGGGDGVRARSV